MKKAILAFLIGIGTGILTNIGQKYLPGSLNSLANSGAVWLIPAFFAAMLGKKLLPSIALCVETLILCVVSYYVFEAVMNNHSFDFFGNYYFYLWLGCAIIFGGVFGAGASLFSRKAKYCQWGANLLPAVFLAEGLSELIHLPDYAHMIPAVIGRIVIGIALYFVIQRKNFTERQSLLAFSVLSILGVLGFELLYLLT